MEKTGAKSGESSNTTKAAANRELSVRKEDHISDQAPQLQFCFAGAAAYSLPSIQPRLTIGKPGDHYEQEADRMADRVMSMPEQGKIQRSCPTCDEDEMQAKPLYQNITPFVQRKKEPEEDDESLQNKLIQRQTEEDDEPVAGKAIEDEAVQTKSGNEETRTADNATEQSLNHSQGHGSSLPANTREFMESRFGADLSDVTVHHDSNAAQLSKQLNAQAFTKGSDIYFNEGKYDPDSSQGKHLLAHELTHTIQQGNLHKKPMGRSTKAPGIHAFSSGDQIPIQRDTTTEKEETYHRASSGGYSITANAGEIVHVGKIVKYSIIQTGSEIPPGKADLQFSWHIYNDELTYNYYISTIDKISRLWNKEFPKISLQIAGPKNSKTCTLKAIYPGKHKIQVKLLREGEVVGQIDFYQQVKGSIYSALGIELGEKILLLRETLETFTPGTPEYKSLDNYISELEELMYGAKPSQFKLEEEKGAYPHDVALLTSYLLRGGYIREVAGLIPATWRTMSQAELTALLSERFSEKQLREMYLEKYEARAAVKAKFRKLNIVAALVIGLIWARENIAEGEWETATAKIAGAGIAAWAFNRLLYARDMPAEMLMKLKGKAFGRWFQGVARTNAKFNFLLRRVGGALLIWDLKDIVMSGGYGGPNIPFDLIVQIDIDDPSTWQEPSQTLLDLGFDIWYQQKCTPGHPEACTATPIYIGKVQGSLLTGIGKLLDIVPHTVPGLRKEIYRIEGIWDEIDLFIVSIVRRRISASENILVVATGERSGEMVSGRGHYRMKKVIPANKNAVNLFGSPEPRFVPEYILNPIGK